MSGVVSREVGFFESHSLDWDITNIINHLVFSSGATYFQPGYKEMIHKILYDATLVFQFGESLPRTTLLFHIYHGLKVLQGQGEIKINPFWKSQAIDLTVIERRNYRFIIHDMHKKSTKQKITDFYFNAKMGILFLPSSGI